LNRSQLRMPRSNPPWTPKAPYKFPPAKRAGVCQWPAPTPSALTAA
jgi:hypothetical protein